MSILKIWKNKGSIIEAIKNKVFKTEHIEEVAKYRLDICAKCPHLDRKGSKCAVPGTQPCCGLCGCSMGLKAYALSAGCDDGRWDPVMTEEEEDALNENLKRDV